MIIFVHFLKQILARICIFCFILTYFQENTASEKNHLVEFVRHIQALHVKYKIKQKDLFKIFQNHSNMLYTKNRAKWRNKWRKGLIITLSLLFVTLSTFLCCRWTWRRSKRNMRRHLVPPSQRPSKGTQADITNMH